MKKFLLGLTFTGVFYATPTMANPAQIAVAKKAILAGEVMPYATPELKSLLKKAQMIDSRLAKEV